MTRILIIEDETAIRTGLTDALVYHGYDVEAVGDGSAGDLLAAGGGQEERADVLGVAAHLVGVGQLVDQPHLGRRLPPVGPSLLCGQRRIAALRHASPLMPVSNWLGFYTGWPASAPSRATSSIIASVS